MERCAPRRLACGKEEVLVAQKGDRVVFRIAHAYLPEAQDLLEDLTDQAEVEGTITDFSDAGEESQAFALVRLYDNQTVIVPVQKLRVVTVKSSQLS
jgi:hypothetical protein